MKEPKYDWAMFPRAEGDDAKREQIKNALLEIQAELGKDHKISSAEFEEGLRKRGLSLSNATSYFVDIEGLRAIASENSELKLFDLKKIKEYIMAYFQQHGRTPKIEEVASQFGWTTGELGKRMASRGTNLTAIFRELGLKKPRGG